MAFKNVYYIKYTFYVYGVLTIRTIARIRYTDFNGSAYNLALITTYNLLCAIRNVLYHINVAEIINFSEDFNVSCC